MKKMYFISNLAQGLINIQIQKEHPKREIRVKLIGSEFLNIQKPIKIMITVIITRFVSNKIFLQMQFYIDIQLMENMYIFKMIVEISILK